MRRKKALHREEGVSSLNQEITQGEKGRSVHNYEWEKKKERLKMGGGGVFEKEKWGERRIPGR